MRLLVTRPEPDGERTAAELRALGHEVLPAPLLRIEPIAGADFGDGPWAAILLTSANGARALAQHPRLAELARVPVLAVGRSSAEAARSAGFIDVESAGGDGGDLVRRAAVRFAGSVKPLLYIAGEDRARELAGLPIRTVVVYRAVKAEAFPPDVMAALEGGRIDGVLHFSRRSVETYLECARPMLARALAPAHYCLSARAAEPLKVAGAAKIVIATRPEEQALLALVTPRP